MQNYKFSLPMLGDANSEPRESVVLGCEMLSKRADFPIIQPSARSGFDESTVATTTRVPFCFCITSIMTFNLLVEFH